MELLVHVLVDEGDDLAPHSPVGPVVAEAVVQVGLDVQVGRRQVVLYGVRHPRRQPVAVVFHGALPAAADLVGVEVVGQVLFPAPPLVLFVFRQVVCLASDLGLELGVLRSELASRGLLQLQLLFELHDGLLLPFD